MSIALDYAHVTIQQMADELGVNRNTVGNYLSGRTKPDRTKVIVWALRTGVPYEWLETGQVDGGGGGDDPVTLGKPGLVLPLKRAA